MGSDFRSVGGAAPCTPRAFIGQAGCGGLQPAANPFCSAHVQPDSRPAAAEPGGMQQCPPPTSGESLAGASPQTKQPAERWYTVLRALQAAPCGSQSEAAAEQQPLDVAGVLRTALQAVRGDEQWNCSGIPELLTRALETAEKGLTSSARKAAVGLLDFHFLVEKYRSVVSRSSTSSASADSAGKRSEADTTSGAEVDSALAGPAAKRPRTCADDASPFAVTSQQAPAPCAVTPTPCQAPVSEAVPATISSADRQGSFALPARPAPRASPSLGPSPAQPGQRTSGGTVRTVQNPVTWSGNISQSVHGRTVTYCGVSIGVPAEHAQDIPATLTVSHLAPRKGIKLGEHSICKCTLSELSRSQTTKLKSLAQHELVMVVPMEDNGMILVPYLDNKGAVKMVAFYIVV